MSTMNVQDRHPQPTPSPARSLEIRREPLGAFKTQASLVGLMTLALTILLASNPAEAQVTSGSAGGGPGVSLLGGGQNTRTPPNSGSTGNDWFPRATAKVLLAAGMKITGTSGVDSDGYVEWISYQRATPSQDFALDLTRVELGPDSGWVRDTGRMQQTVGVRRAYLTSTQRANAYGTQIQQTERKLQALRTQHNETNHPRWREMYARQYKEATEQLMFLAKIRQEEFALQRVLRPGR